MNKFDVLFQPYQIITEEKIFVLKVHARNLLLSLIF